jgi:hypothetical protein
MVRVMFYKDVFVPKQRHIKATVELRTSTQRVQVEALIDSGAMDNFISPSLTNCYQLPLEKIKHPRIIRNVDGTVVVACAVSEQRCRAPFIVPRVLWSCVALHKLSHCS